MYMTRVPLQVVWCCFTNCNRQQQYS